MDIANRIASLFAAPESAAVAVATLALAASLAAVILLLYALCTRKSSAAALREELSEALAAAADRNADDFEARQNRLEDRLSRALEAQRRDIDSIRKETAEKLDAANDRQKADMRSVAESVTAGISSVNGALAEKLETMRRLNDEKLDAMRETVGEKLQGALETKLSESFDAVVKQLLALEKGLGEVRSLASNVDTLKRVMTNVKTRGAYGEAQLESILSDVLAQGQYEKNVETVPGSGKRVEFAVKMPGPGRGDTVWLPIDSKFPLEDWNRLEDARLAADRNAETEAVKSLRSKILEFARDIATKYVKIPHTAEFAVMFLPAESLYAEVLRIPGLADEMRQKWRVTPAGPTVMASLLSSLRMGFRTLAIEERSAEVWRLLGTFKEDFRRFSESLDAVDKRIGQAQEAVAKVKGRTERMGRRLEEVESVPGDDDPPRLEQP